MVWGVIGVKTLVARAGLADWYVMVGDVVGIRKGGYGWMSCVEAVFVDC